MGSIEFDVARIVSVSLGTVPGLTRFVILEDPKKERVFVPGQSIGHGVDEICVGSRLRIEIDEETGLITNVSRATQASIV